MKTNNTKKWKKIFGISLACVLSAGSLAGIGVGAYNISQTTNISSDFSQGHSIQLNLRLFKTDDKGNILFNKQTKEPIRIYDQKTEEQNIKDSAKALTTVLQNKGLTNLKISYGYSYIKNSQKVDANTFLFKDSLEPIGILNANFENAESAFGLKDIKNEVNDLFNNKQIFDNLNDSFAYEIELVKPSYENKQGNYQIKTKANTFRSPNTSILTNEKAVIPTFDENIDNFSYYDTSLMKDNKINVFIDRDNKEDSNAIAYTLKKDLTWNYFNSYQFGKESKEYKELEKNQNTNGSSNSSSSQFIDLLANTDSGSSDSNNGNNSSSNEPAPNTPPTDLQKFQTKYTWFLWKDKQGLIDYLNSLIGIWYFNIYANKIPNSVFNDINGNNPDKTKIIENLFPTGDDPKFVRGNGTSIATRNKINVVINNLSDIEKSFIAHTVLYNGYPNNTNEPLYWTPPLIQENDLIPVLYNFLNDKIFSPVTPVDPNNIASDNKDGVSESVKSGWSFLESTNTDLQTFIGQYYAGTIDYRNFESYFQNPNKPKEPTNDDPEPIQDPYITNQFKINTNTQSIQNASDFAQYLNTNNYKFPLYVPNTQNLVEDWGRSGTGKGIAANILELDKLYSNVTNKNTPSTPTITFDQYTNKVNEFANKYFISNNLYSNQYITPASIASSIVSSNLNPLNILFIVLGSIIFLVGIFVSIRYRIPGLFSFIFSGLVFVLSTLLYNVFGYVFSFYSLLAVAVGTFLSFIVSSFLFRNIEKEISEGSTLSAAILKSTKKYWKMSLDTHVMSILASLAFLFFGKNGNINFGAMLVISVFLSFILSGIIYYILLLLYVYVIQFENNDWFISKRLFDKLLINHLVKKIYFYNRINFFNKPSYIVVAVLILIGLVGSILVATNGPFFSIDFSSSSILIINNFNNFNLTQSQIINALSITSSNAYVYNNQLVIYTLNNLNINNVLNTLKPLIDSNMYTSLADNLSITTLTSEYAVSIVNNTLECMGIAIGLCAVWSLLSLNIISVIPFALIQLLSMVITVGFTSLVAIPIDLNSIAGFIFIFIISSAFSASLISNIKNSWDRKMLISKNDLKTLINNIVAKITPNYVWILGLIAIFSIFSLALSSTTLILAFIVLFIGILYLVFANNSILVLVWFWFVLIRNIFNKELLKSKNEKLHHVHDYDDVNEQKIIGVNC